MTREELKAARRLRNAAAEAEFKASWRGQIDALYLESMRPENVAARHASDRSAWRNEAKRAIRYYSVAKKRNYRTRGYWMWKLRRLAGWAEDLGITA